MLPPRYDFCVSYPALVAAMDSPDFQEADAAIFFVELPINRINFHLLKSICVYFPLLVLKKSINCWQFILSRGLELMVKGNHVSFVFSFLLLELLSCQLPQPVAPGRLFLVCP